MTNKAIFILILLIVSFTSCDPAIGVVISNKTSTDKQIKVIYPTNFKFPSETDYGGCGIRDSIITYDLNITDKYLYPFIVPRLSWDSIARSYSFSLKANHSAKVECRSIATNPTYGQIFIVDNKDTVELKQHGKIFIKKPKLCFGGTWTYTIIDKK